MPRTKKFIQRKDGEGFSASEVRVRELEDENLELVNGPRCVDCDDTGLLENGVEEKYPCTCITETEYWEWNEARESARETMLVEGLRMLEQYFETHGKVISAIRAREEGEK